MQKKIIRLFYILKGISYICDVQFISSYIICTIYLTFGIEIWHCTYTHILYIFNTGYLINI